MQGVTGADPQAEKARREKEKQDQEKFREAAMRAYLESRGKPRFESLNAKDVEEIKSFDTNLALEVAEQKVKLLDPGYYRNPETKRGLVKLDDDGKSILILNAKGKQFEESLDTGMEMLKAQGEKYAKFTVESKHDSHHQHPVHLTTDEIITFINKAREHGLGVDLSNRYVKDCIAHASDEKRAEIERLANEANAKVVAEDLEKRQRINGSVGHHENILGDAIKERLDKKKEYNTDVSEGESATAQWKKREDAYKKDVFKSDNPNDESVVKGAQGESKNIEARLKQLEEATNEWDKYTKDVVQVLKNPNLDIAGVDALLRVHEKDEYRERREKIYQEVNKESNDIARRIEILERELAKIKDASPASPKKDDAVKELDKLKKLQERSEQIKQDITTVKTNDTNLKETFAEAKEYRVQKKASMKK